ncbi:MAG: hypothetical protein ACYCW6_19530, partial [Candidatus Xenobia bacterium]
MAHTLIKDLIHIPEQVHKGDFVLKLTEGVEHARQTLDTYVVTPQLKGCFDRALHFIQSAVTGQTSKAAYLHGSFGAGKSHFMAVLHLMLQHHPEAWTHHDLAEICANHPWIEGRKFLLVPFHMIGARSLEAAVFSGYVEHVRRLHPDAPHPGVYQSEAIFDNAERMRALSSEEKFFARLNEGLPRGRWGTLSAGWDAESYDRARTMEPGHPDRVRLVGAIVKNLLPAVAQNARSEGETYVSLDDGLSILSQHTQALGYQALILFLDELILWLASHAADLPFVHREGQKLSKLVEAQRADRPVPIISFVARQRDLRELVGESVTGAEKLGFSDALKHWEGRFETITLEDRNLPEIAEKRVLRPRSDEAKQELDAAFARTESIRGNVMEILLTRRGDRTMFRKVYPFSPALVETLVAVSGALQRERTAIKIMLELLVNQRNTLQVGEIIPVGDLYDVIETGDEPFSDFMRNTFDNARRLYRQRLLPLLEENAGVRWDTPVEQLETDRERKTAWLKLFNDARLIKTLLLAAMVPEVESLKNLTGPKLAALNYGSIRSVVPNQEGKQALHKIRQWASQIGEIKLTGDEANPYISIQLTGIDLDGILAQASHEDNQGNRRRQLRRLIFSQMGLGESEEAAVSWSMLWKGTSRVAQVIFARVRELSDDQLAADADTWKVLVDFPFDDAHAPADALSRFERWQTESRPPTRTMAWIPSYFTSRVMSDLGTLAVLHHILEGDRLRQYVAHLPPQDREVAKRLLENRRDSLTITLKEAIAQAYGLTSEATHALDPAYTLEKKEHFASLWSGFEPRPPVAVELGPALNELLAQALEVQFPAHPNFGGKNEITRRTAATVLQQVEKALEDPDGRVQVDKNLRQLLWDIAVPLKLG